MGVRLSQDQRRMQSMQLSEKEKYVVAMVEPHLIKASNDVEIDFEVIKYEIKTILEQLTND